MRTIRHVRTASKILAFVFVLMAGGALGAAQQELPPSSQAIPDIRFMLDALFEANPRPSNLILSGLYGGDTRLILNAARSRMTVRVTDGSLESRFGLALPTEAYEIDVHNRVVDTIEAPFTPSLRSASLLSDMMGLTCRPQPFPPGTWDITAICPREDKYGPYMIKTNAVGRVSVYSPGTVEGSLVFIGNYEDAGYAIHANTVPFEYSKSFGCIVARSEDVARLARSLQADRQRDPDAEQVICVPRFGRAR